MPRRIDAAELVAALGGLVVVVALFLEWFGPATGWQAFEALDLVLAALAVAAAAAGATALGVPGEPGPRALLPIGLAMTVIVAVQLIEPPPVAGDLDLGTGAWVALAGSLLVLAAGILRAVRIHVTVSVGPRDTRARVPAVDRRPAAATTADVPGDGTAAEPPRRSLLDDDRTPGREQATQSFQPVDEDQ